MPRSAAHHCRRIGALLMCWAACHGWAGAGEPLQFLIFHVDAVAAVDFDRLLATGRLPNVARAFEGGSAHHALSLFYGATRVIYPRMHGRADLSVLGGIGFGGYDREAERVVGDIEGILSLLAAVPRRAVTNFLHGIPYLDGLAGLAMQNLPDQLERYQVVEFFWFSSDAVGHLYGADAHAASLERFDAHLGRVLPRLDLERVNLLLYTDHGMTFTDQTVDLAAILERVVGEELIYFKYPILYLRDLRAFISTSRTLTSANLVVGLAPPRIPLGVLTQGGHSGLVDTDLLVKVLARGPLTEPLRELGVTWLTGLYRDLPDIAFGCLPERELHEVAVRWRLDDLTPGARLSLSPSYRTRLTADVEPGSWSVWTEHDVFASYLTRWWFGVGAGGGAGEPLQPLARAALEVAPGEARLDLEAYLRPAGWSFELGMSFQVGSCWRLSWGAPAGIGVGRSW